ncbi:MAG: hypothetical protein Q4Q58_06760, partial [Thermoplasmata archaeon]|nr:hypothetical protein [Thermoplasmata archaeon]
AEGGKIILTWGNTIKVAVVGCFSYLFLKGGLSNVVSTTLGIPEWAAQVIIVVAFIAVLALIIRYLVNYARDRMNLKQEYLDTPVFGRDRIQYDYGGNTDAYWYDADERRRYR